jgi:hypothetical protein
MTVLSVVSSASKRVGLGAVSSLVGSTDANVLQLLELLNEEGQALADEYRWQALIRDASFTTLAAQLQGALATIAPWGFMNIISGTFWNRTEQRPVVGPLSPEQWRRLNDGIVSASAIPPRYRIHNGSLYFLVAPTAGQTCNFAYWSKNWVTDSTGVTGSDEVAADTDLPLIDDKLLIMGCVWRWKQVKGLEYAGDLEKYNRRLANLLARDGSKQTVSLDGVEEIEGPVAIVPEGSWSI